MVEQEPEASGGTAAEMPLTAVVASYIEMQGWDDELEIDQGARLSTLAARFNIDGQRTRLYVETNEERETVTVFLYSPFAIGPERMGEAARLINIINCELRLGRLSCLDDGDSNYVQFKLAHDFTNAQCSPQQIDVMVGAGLWTLRHYGQALAAVAFADLAAKDSWAAHQQREQAARPQEESPQLGLLTGRVEIDDA
jgi:hypothetical protein